MYYISQKLYGAWVVSRSPSWLPRRGGDSVAIKENWNALDLTLKYVRFGPQCAKLLKYSYFQLKLDQNSLKSGAKSGGAKDFVRHITNKRASSDVKSARMAMLIFVRYLTWQLTRIKTNDG